MHLYVDVKYVGLYAVGLNVVVLDAVDLDVVGLYWMKNVRKCLTAFSSNMPRPLSSLMNIMMTQIRCY